MELVDFLHARLDEDESAARDATNDPWWDEDTSARFWGDERDAEVACSQGRVATLPHEKNGVLNAIHIARHHPARILAEVETKRRLLEVHAPQPEPFSPSQKGCRVCSDNVRSDWRANWPCLTLRMLARPYRDHPDFDPAWLED